MKHGIDISKWQEEVDWAELAAQHRAGSLDFVIMRAGLGGGTIDPRFEEYYAAAHAAGIPVGAYWYAYWGPYTPSQEAASFLRAVEGKTLEYGLWYDVEYEPDILGMSRQARTDKVLEGLDALAASGRYVGLYASTDMINNRLEYNRLRGYDLWVAQYAARNTCKLPYGIWQYTSGGSVPGIAGRVDCDRAYKDYPAFVLGPLAGGSKTGGSKTGGSAANEPGGTADKPLPEPLPGPAPGQEDTAAPCRTLTRRYGPMTKGDLLQLLKTADGLGLYILGELTIGPVSTGDDAALCALADGLGLGYGAAG